MQADQLAGQGARRPRAGGSAPSGAHRRARFRAGLRSPGAVGRTPRRESHRRNPTGFPGPAGFPGVRPGRACAGHRRQAPAAERRGGRWGLPQALAFGAALPAAQRWVGSESPRPREPGLAALEASAGPFKSELAGHVARGGRGSFLGPSRPASPRKEPKRAFGGAGCVCMCVERGASPARGTGADPVTPGCAAEQARG